MQLYAITDRRLFAHYETLVTQASIWAAGGVDYIQIREKDLATDDLIDLTSKIVRAVRRAGGKTRVLLNGAVEAAEAAGCDGVHLPSGLPAAAIDQAKARMDMVSISCHTMAEIEMAREHGATLALFAPVFEKRIGEDVISGEGLGALAAACRVASPMPIFALGGVHAENARDCVDAGAAGIAAIRLFAGDGWKVLSSLRR